MSKAQQLITTTNIVKKLLTEDPQTRNSDSYLYLKVLEHCAMQKGIDLQLLSVSAFLTSRNLFGFPCFETVRRTRQKTQRNHPELAANETVQGFRAENEIAYAGYARGSV